MGIAEVEVALVGAGLEVTRLDDESFGVFMPHVGHVANVSVSARGVEVYRPVLAWRLMVDALSVAGIEYREV